MNKKIHQNLLLAEKIFSDCNQDYRQASFSATEDNLWDIYFAVLEADSFPDMLSPSMGRSHFSAKGAHFYCPAFRGVSGINKLTFTKSKNALMSYTLSVDKGKTKIPLLSLLETSSYVAFSEEIVACLKKGHDLLKTYIDWRNNPDENNAQQILNYVKDVPLALPLLFVCVNNISSAVKLYEILNEEQKKFLTPPEAEELLNNKRRAIEHDKSERSTSIGNMATIFRIYQQFEALESRIKMICSYHDLKNLPEKLNSTKKRKI